MNILIEWVMQIIIFILIGTMVQLIIPSNKMKRYVQIVISLLLLLLLMQPILYLFSMNRLTTEFSNVHFLLDYDPLLVQTEKELERQKREIEMEQAAYIWSEVEKELVQLAKDRLQKEYGAKITDMQFLSSVEHPLHIDQIETIGLTMEEINDNERKPYVEIIKIDTEKVEKERTDQTEKNEREGEIKQLLQDLWDVEKEKMTIQWEGGTD